MRYSDPKLVEDLAARYALGTMGRGARARFKKLAAQRTDVRLAVEQWSQVLHTLSAGTKPQPAPERVWKHIEGRLFGAPELAIKKPVSLASDWLNWLGIGLGGLVLGALASVAVLSQYPGLVADTDQIAMKSGEKLPQSYVGLLTDEQGTGRLLISSLRHGRTLILKLIGPPPGLAAPAQGAYVAWALPPADAPTQSPLRLGALPVKGSAAFLLPDTSEKLFSKVTKLIVTLELDPNATQPSANIVLRGNCAKLW